jgi:hypothetical protein
VRFPHPETGKMQTIKAEYDLAFKQALRVLAAKD